MVIVTNSWYLITGFFSSKKYLIISKMGDIKGKCWKGFDIDTGENSCY